MTNPTVTNYKRTGGLDEAFREIDWSTPAISPAPAGAPSVAAPPRGPRPSGLWAKARSFALLVAVPLVAVAARSGADGPARYGPIPAGGEGPLGQVALTGPWQVALDPRSTGESRGFQRGRFDGPPVAVPFVPNANTITGPAGSRSFAGSTAWYKTGLRLAGDGTYAIRFASVNHVATVWLDGRRVARHTGTYLPFDVKVRAGAGEHLLVVHADWRDPAAMARAGFHRTWFNFGGINRPVTIRPLGPSEVLTPSVQTRLSRSGADVSVRAVVHNYGPARMLGLDGTLVHGGQRIGLHFVAQPVAAGRSVAEVATAHIDDPALWRPGQPNLYDLDVVAAHESGYHGRIGLRQLSWDGGTLRINGHRVALHGASIQEDVLGHGDGLTPADQDRLVGQLRALGANATRAQHPLDAGLLQRLDAAGILVWEGVGPVDPAGGFSATTPSLRRAAEHRARTTVRQQQVHPSIVAWNLANEVAGNGHPGGQAAYIDGMASWIHRTDPGRMVAVDVWGEHPPRVAGALYRHLDAVGLTNYEGWYEDPLAPRSTVARRIRERVLALMHTFADKVVAVSEFGAEANGANPTARPGGYAYQADLIGLHLSIYRALPHLSGMLVWDLGDFGVAPSFAGGSISRRVPGIHLVKGLNQKGLYDYAGVPKPAVAVVTHAFARMAPVG